MPVPAFTVRADPPRQVEEAGRRRAESFRKASRLSAALTVAVGALVLAGWLFGVRALIQLVPGAIAMVPNSAIGFALAGLSLWLQAGRQANSSRRLSRVAAGAAGLLGLLELAQYVSRADFGIDQLLFRDPSGLTSIFPGRMAVLTALGFIAIAGALLTSGSHRAGWLTDALALVPGLLALLSLAGYAYGVRSLYWIGTYKGMAVHTALAFLFLTFGTLFTRPDRPISSLILSESIGGVMVRRLLPFAIAIPVVLGWLERKGRRAELYDGDFGAALVVVASVVFIGALVGWQGAALERIDRARFEATRETERAFETLARREGHFRSLIENAQDVITIVDAQGTIGYMSPAAERILGRPPNEFLGMSVFSLLHPDDTAVAQAAIARVLGNPETPRTWLIRLRHASGSWRTMEVIGKLLEGEGPPQIVVNSRDVTESRALEEQLRQAQKMEAVGRLAGGIAHDFNNLLTAIMGYAELATARLKPGDPSLVELSEIDKAAQRAADLTRQLLAFSRKQVLQPRVINLNEVVSGIDKMLRRLIGEDIALVTLPRENLGSVKADTGQMEQVLLNLAVNSRDAMPSGGKLTIETSEVDLDESYAVFHFDVPPGRYVLLAVSDTGSGMDATTLSHVFEPFFTTKEVGKGTGLGLSMVYGVVKQSGGHVTAYSEAGVGTTFKIYLPRVEDLADKARVSSEQPRRAGASETLLVVEDEDAIRRLVCRSLDAHGYKTLPAADASEGLLVCEEHAGEIHLMLTDVVMPHLSGRELARRAAALRPHMKVLFMSGYTDDAIVQHGVLEAGTPFLQKPFTPSDLTRKVREVLDGGSS